MPLKGGSQCSWPFHLASPQNSFVGTFSHYYRLNSGKIGPQRGQGAVRVALLGGGVGLEAGLLTSSAFDLTVSDMRMSMCVCV